MPLGSLAYSWLRSETFTQQYTSTSRETTMTRPKFGALFTGEWPYEYWQGVGLHLRGSHATDFISFRSVMIGFSCPVDVAFRLAETMQRSHEIKTTVMSHLDFNALARLLAVCGVDIKIIPPVTSAAKP